MAMGIKLIIIFELKTFTFNKGINSNSNKRNNIYTNCDNLFPNTERYIIFKNKNKYIPFPKKLQRQAHLRKPHQWLWMVQQWKNF